MTGIGISNWRARQSGTLRGHFTAALISGLTLHELSLHTRDGSWWVAMPCKPQIGAYGGAMRDLAGKVRYGPPLITFASKEIRNKFNAQVVAALRLAVPEVFGAEDGAT
jgi:hypothetical protein